LQIIITAATLGLQVRVAGTAARIGRNATGITSKTQPS
jgi:hypothetical protein